MRRYAFACLQCRRKKLRCDGEEPTCKRCRQGKEACQYPGRSAERRLDQAHARIEELEGALARVRQCVPQPSTSATAVPSTLNLDTVMDSPESGNDGGYIDNVVSEPDHISPHIGLDEHGDFSYHGPTSRFSTGSLAGLHSETPRGFQRALENFSVSISESNVSLQRQVWEPLLHNKSESELGAPNALVQKLLGIYWTWQYPLHNYVYKPCFVMDMALGGPYYSKFLLHSILALASRHLDIADVENSYVEKGERFLASSKLLLIDELAAPKPRIPTIQGLLILGGRQCAVGKTSEGWLFTGMAIRMMTDLGLHLDLDQLAQVERLTPMDLEIRKRLYCSAYIWDKSLSISLGRRPALTRTSPVPLDFLDYGDEYEKWEPQDSDDDHSAHSHNTSCFLSFCRLGSIIELILLPVKKSMHPEVLEKRLSKLERRLLEWHDEMPSPIKMGPACEVCPPPHILSLNLLFHTLFIILWRPYMHIPETAVRATEVCTEKARIVHKMFILYGRAFQWKRMTYLVGYCVYSAATIDVEQVKSHQKEIREDATNRLAISLKILETEAAQTPGISRSIDIIKRQLRTWEPQRRAHLPSETSSSHTIPGQSNLSDDRRGAGGQQAQTPPSFPAVNEQPSDLLYARNSSFHEADEDGPNFDFHDTGAGFHPDAFPWGFINDTNVDMAEFTFLETGFGE